MSAKFNVGARHRLAVSAEVRYSPNGPAVVVPGKLLLIPSGSTVTVIQASGDAVRIKSDSGLTTWVPGTSLGEYLGESGGI